MPGEMRDRVASRLALFSLLLAGLGALALVAGPLGMRAGLWDFPTGFVLLRWAFRLGAGALLLSLIAVARALVASRGGRAGFSPALLAALALALVAAGIPYGQWRKVGAVPPINDITTDPEAPPQFVAAGRGAENGAAGAPYPGAEFAAAQRAAYPDLATLHFAQPPVAVFHAVLETARETPGWEVVLADSTAGRIEATATTRWFRFKDDVAIRIRPEGAGSAVDLRSRSRVGRSDVGANAERIQEFSEELVRRLGAANP